jgi:hypothetical protein
MTTAMSSVIGRERKNVRYTDINEYMQPGKLSRKAYRYKEVWQMCESSKGNRQSHHHKRWL